MTGGSRAPEALLVVIDMQRVFAEPESPWATPGYEGVVEPVQRLVEAYGDRAVFTRFVLPDQPTGSWVPYYELWNAVTLPEASHLFDLAEPFASRRPRTLDRPTFSKWGPQLHALAGPVGTLVLCGVATDCCVISTALPAADAGMFVRVVADACAGVNDAAHHSALGVMAGYAPQIVLTSVEEEIAAATMDQASFSR